MPDDPRSRYLLVIEPPPEVHAVVSEWKRVLRERIGGYSGSRLVPHVTLFLADLPDTCADDVRQGIARGCAGTCPFLLHYDGITHFPDRRTVYIHPVEEVAIAHLRGPIVEQVRAFAHLREAVRATDRPHLTIAAGLGPKQFDMVWSFLASHAFHGVQHVTEVLLLERPLAGGPYVEVERFPLGMDQSSNSTR